MGYSFRLAARVFYMHYLTDSTVHTSLCYTSYNVLDGMREEKKIKKKGFNLFKCSVYCFNASLKTKQSSRIILIKFQFKVIYLRFQV